MYRRFTTANRRTNGPTKSATPADDSSDNATNQRTGTASTIIVGSSESIETNATAVEERLSGKRTSEVGEGPESGQLILIPINEYQPGMTVRVVDRLPAPIVVQLLRLPNGETVSVLQRPDEYTGYVVRSEFREDLVHSTMIVFTRELLESDACYIFEADVQVFSSQLNLFQTTGHRISLVDNGGDNS